MHGGCHAKLCLPLTDRSQLPAVESSCAVTPAPEPCKINAMSRSGLHLLSILGAFSILVLVMSGAALTSSHAHSTWTWLLTVHVAVAIAATLLTLGLAVALSRFAQPDLAKQHVARFGWIILVALQLEIVVGYPRKTSTGPVAGTLHAALASFLFAALSAIDRLTSRSWQRNPDPWQSYAWPALKCLSTAPSLL